VASDGEFDELTQAGANSRPTPLSNCAQLRTSRRLRAMVKFMNKLVDRIGDQENHPLMGLLDIVTAFVHDYEEWNVEISGRQFFVVLRFLSWISTA